MRLSFNHIKECKLIHSFAHAINPFVYVMFFFFWNFPFFLRSRNHSYEWIKPLSANPTKWSNTLKHCFSVFDHFVKLALKELSNVGNTIWPSWSIWLKQNDLLNVILYGEQKLWSQQKSKYDGDKNFDRNSNQSILTATIKSVRYTSTIHFYGSTNYFLSNSINNPR